MNYPFWTRVALTLFGLLLIAYSSLLVSNMICRTSLRSCRTSADCEQGTACINYGSGEVRCTPAYCSSIHKSTLNVQAMTQRAAGVISMEAARFGLWIVHFEKTKILPFMTSPKK
ncbi:MAG TPA: hypothetical protein VHA78_02985 [Candidatus Peribacteraceae bacterium]|nr:hypothetical protein [Candidatus Peribacteraceae bacterium]